MAQNAYGAQFIVNNILPVKPLIFPTFFLCDLLQLLVDVEELEIWNTHRQYVQIQNSKLFFNVWRNKQKTSYKSKHSSSFAVQQELNFQKRIVHQMRFAPLYSPTKIS